MVRNFLYGFIIGIGFIIPGVSGSVLATVLGIYEEILERINNIFKNFLDNLQFLLPIFLGIIVNVLLFSRLILYLINNKTYFISYVFIGLILGCVPHLLNEINVKTNKKLHMFSFALALGSGIFLYIIKNILTNDYLTPSIGNMVLSGIFYSIGKIVPGISGSALLMLLGVYKYFLQVVVNLFSINLDTIFQIFPFTVSFFISSIFVIKIINYLLKNYFYYTYSSIIGFVISSTIFIYPDYFSFTSLVILTLSFIISYNLTTKLAGRP